jgi:hypothetical protein
VSDGVSGQRLFGHRICDVCKGTDEHCSLSPPIALSLACSASACVESVYVSPGISCLPGDGLTEDSYREKMFDKSEEREEMRQALVSEGEDTRLAVYAEVHGEEAASAQRSSKPERKKKKKKKSKKKKAEEEEAEEYAEGDGEDEYVDEDAAELARMAQEERLAQMQEDGEEDDEAEQDDGDDDDDDEYGGME